MSNFDDHWSLIVGIIFVAILLLGVGIFAIFYSFLIRRANENSKRKDRQLNRFPSGGLFPIRKDSSNYSESEEFLLQSRVQRLTEIECSLEYRTRGSQLIMSLAKVSPSDLCNNLIKDLSLSKMFFVVFLNGDYTNIPCESIKKTVEKAIDINEIFIFTVMPYDLPTLELIVQAILLTDSKKYIIGTLKIPLYDLDQQSTVVQKAYSLPFPDEKVTLSDCLLCLSIMNCKNLMKIKIIRFHMLDCSFPDENITGLSLRLTMESPDKPAQTFDSTKKKYKSSLMFNETIIFETIDLEKKDLQLSIQLLESRHDNMNETVNVCGTIKMSYDIFQENSFNQKWMEAIDNLDTELIRWYPISYDIFK